MTDGPARPPGLDRLEEQIEEILDDTATSRRLLGRLDLESLRDRDRYADWHASSPLIPMVRAFLFKELQDLSYSELHRHIDGNEDTATAFQFDEVPSRSTFSRTWSNRFDDELQSLIKVGAERIRKMARLRGVLIGSRAVKPENKEGISERTEDRFISEKAEEVTREMQRLVFPAFDFGRAENAHYEDETFLELQSHLGLSDTAAESGTDLFQQDTQRPEGSPDADTHLYNIKRLDRDDVAKMMNAAIDRMVSETDRQLKSNRHVDFSRPVDVAVDMTYIAYYGQREGLEMVYGAPPSKGYEWCYKFATAAIVGPKIKLTVALRPLQKGESRVGTILRELVEQAQNRVNIDVLYADSEFCSVETFRSMDELGVNYVIPSRKNKRVKREIDRMRHDIEVRQEHVRYGPVADGRTSQPGHTNLVLMPSTQDPDKTVAFTTNLDVNHETPSARLKARGQMLRYRRRWGIENSYKTIKDFLAWTTSKEFVVRFFYFGFAVLLYNMWLLVDLIVQFSLGEKRPRKPRVTAKRFLNLARKFLRETD